MGRMYAVITKHSAISGARDLQELTMAAAKVGVIHRVTVTQDDNETSQQLPIEIARCSASGTGGAALAAGDVEKLDPGDAAHAFTGEKDNTTRATQSGPGIWRNSQNAINGWDYAPTPEERPVIGGGGIVSIGLPVAPNPALSFTVVTTIEEIG